MVIVVDLQQGDPAPVSLRDPDDCGRFHVEVIGPRDDARLGHALVDADVGRVVDEHAFVDIGAVRRMAAGWVGESWADDFEKMVAYARSKGWLDETGNAIQAHVEWMDP
jgi:hypothetical protein